jgi:hypothetical protein
VNGVNAVGDDSLVVSDTLKLRVGDFCKEVIPGDKLAGKPISEALVYYKFRSHASVSAFHFEISLQ